jgi:glutamine synthetase
MYHGIEVAFAATRNTIKEHVMTAKKPGLYANIHAKQERIANGSGEHMNKSGSKDAPSVEDFKKAAKPEKKAPAKVSK